MSEVDILNYLQSLHCPVFNLKKKVGGEIKTGAKSLILDYLKGWQMED